MATNETSKIGDQLREAIRKSGLSMYRVSRSSGVHESSVSRFMAGQGELRLDSLEKICGVLGLEPRLIKPRAKK